MAPFCDLDGLGAVAGALPSLEGACCCCFPSCGVSTTILLLLLTGGGTAMDRSEGGLGESGGGAGTSVGLGGRAGEGIEGAACGSGLGGSTGGGGGGGGMSLLTFETAGSTCAGGT